jgi:hypothetical protein
MITKIKTKGCCAYEARELAARITEKYKNIRQTADYEELQGRIIEHTMACDKQEQLEWMKHYMRQAIHQSREACKNIQNGNSRAQAQFEAALLFIAAYDLI